VPSEDLPDFADPWEQIRLLADGRRNEALSTLLRRYAKDARVLEVGTGTGLFACAAAKLGAAQVIAVELSDAAEVARELARRNGLEHHVEVVPAMLGELEPRPVDLAFGELLNADPFVEGVVQTFVEAAAWVVPGGRLAPRRLRVLAAPVRATEGHDESRAAQAQVRALGEVFDLEVGGLCEWLLPPGADPYLTPRAELLGPPVTVFDVALGQDDEPPESTVVSLSTPTSAPITAVATWFEAELDDDLWIRNRPEAPGHFGLLVHGLAAPLEEPRVRFEVDDDDRLSMWPED
jgi:SAM-dependent methyltransferase